VRTTPSRVPASRIWLAIEFVVLFVGAVGGYALLGSPGSPLPPLAVVAIAAFVYLWRKPGFDRRNLWRPEAVRGELPSILAIWAVAVVVAIVAIAAFAPQRLFDIPRHSPLLWLAIMIFYPLVSVYPQEVVFRAFVLERYAPALGSGWVAVGASAAVFGFVHIIFGHLLSVGLSFLGGLLFAYRYRRSRSLLAAAIEHSLYGQLIFTVGLGAYFYHGA
jgi:membrane protease YdiL (CAAX protease family)